ncbi:MAG: hypothetical protein QNK03_10705 [Myxococcota bacterium]|nr:hypothetical protein [Myxococcota bacterium]
MPEGAAPATHPDLAALTRWIADELDGPVPAAIRGAAEAIRRRHRGAAAVLFYGSCLRRDTTEGVLDFYVLVDRYRPAHRSALVAALNRLLPPNVFYWEDEVDDAGKLRAKYAVISTEQFARRARRASPDCRIWSRFCQPARIAWVRDEETRRAVHDAVVRATLTAADWMSSWLDAAGGVQRVRPAELWVRGFRETYGAELRGEKLDTVDAVYREQGERFDRLTPLALRALAAHGRLRVLQLEPEIQLDGDPARLSRMRRSWRVRRPLTKALAVLGLLKTPVTFDGWVSYALWKVERHSGVHVEVTDLQRRHPLLFGWPVLFRLIRHRILR